METIKVNMSPNPLDVQTIHASQNDGEARQWGFELHNNGELIDTSDVKEQMVFKSYKGGTEQLLPENTSTPTTSPFKGNIKYPQGLLSDQEFLYRESPTESDGLAKIQTIYGNTLKWNQLMRNGNFADGTSYYSASASTITVSDGILTMTKNQNTGAGVGYARPTNFNYVVGHKYLARVDYKGIAGKMLTMFSNSFSSGMISVIPTDGNWHTISNIFNVTALPSVPGILWLAYETTTDDNVAQFRNYAIFDLTQMGLDSITSVDEFTSLFPLPYYAYNQGTLLSFNGNGIKTVGKNLLDKTLFSENSTAKPEQTSTGVKVISKNGQAYGYVDVTVLSDLTPFVGKTFILSANVQTSNSSGLALQVRDENNVEKAWRITYTTGPASVTLAITDDFIGCYLRVAIYAIGGSGVVGDYSIYDNLQLEIGSSQVTSYEPYTESTLSLPISTYFPTGMKSAGNVYDELTESKAITRVGMVDLGTLNYTRPENSSQFRSTTALQNAKLPSRSTEMLNAKSALYNATDYITMINSDMALTIVFSGSFAQGQVWIKNSNYTDATAFKTAMDGVYLYYELATETETPITTASLVTENAEIPLSNEDGILIGKCTEQLSENPGFFDAKIKLSDGDGTCYSNKLQLHVERSPQ